MSDKPTGAFVRLPLSEAQVESVLNSYTGDKESTNVCMQKTILDLGTPVTGGDLSPVAYINPRKAASPNVSFRPFHDYQPLVRQSDAQAQIAALEAEVVRLREAILEARDQAAMGFSGGPYVILNEALKGGAA